MRKILLVFLIGSIALSCTIGVVLPSASSDGTPLIFKTRDISGWTLEFETNITSSDYGYAYTYNKYTSNSTVWMGVNDAGFAIVQSAAYNVSSSGSGFTNGSLQNHALENCATVAEFEAILDATIGARAVAANYGVIDAYGDGAIYEVSTSEHMRYDPDTSGIITRGNFSYIGSDTVSTARRGLERMNRAKYLMQYAKSVDSLTAEFIGMHVIADLERLGDDPYPLPFTGSFDGINFGYVDTDDSNVETINNEQTHVAGIFQGVAPGGNPENSLVYGYFACPAVSVPFVIFPASLSPTSITTGSVQLNLADACRDKYDEAFDLSDVTKFNTGYLLDEYGGGIWTYTRDINRWVYDTVRTQLAIWDISPPSASEREDFQEEVLISVYEAYTGGFSVGTSERPIPVVATLDAYPNPFNAAVEIVHEDRLHIYDAKGQLVTTLEKGQDTWRPKNLPSGVYTASSKSQNASVKLIYLK